MIGAIILGIVAGFLGRALMPGKDPMGFLMTILLGLAGAVVGFLIFTELLGIGDNKVFDLGGLIGSIIGVMILLGLYRAFARKDEPRGTTRRDRLGEVEPPHGLEQQFRLEAIPRAVICGGRTLNDRHDAVALPRPLARACARPSRARG